MEFYIKKIKQCILNNKLIAIMVVIAILLTIFGGILYYKTYKKPMSDENIRISSNSLKNTGKANLFIGGIVECQDGQRLDAVTDSGLDFSAAYQYIKEDILKSDLAFCTFNGVVVPEQKGYSGYPMYFTPDKFINDISLAGFDVVSLNTDNCFNDGISGIETTLKSFEQNSVKTVGVSNKNPEPLIFTKNNIKFGVLSYFPSDYTNFSLGEDEVIFYTESLKNEIKKDSHICKENKCDVIIAFSKWNENEGLVEPSAEMKQLSEYMISVGVDLVIGNSECSVLPVEQIKTDDYYDVENSRTGYVAYSLGNFYSSRKSDNGDIGAFLNIEITKTDDAYTRINKIDATPVFISSSISDGKNIRIIPVNDNSFDCLDEEGRKRYELVREYVRIKLNWKL